MSTEKPPEPAPERMRTRDEIQRAHDVLWAQVTGDAPFVFEEDARPLATVALDVLCWALRHEHNMKFAEVLATIDGELARQGLQMYDSGRPTEAATSPPAADVAPSPQWPPMS